MKLSIIIPTLNESAIIQACLLSLQALRNKAEIIVTDGGSGDNTFELTLPYADKVLSSERGRARQMNHGAQHATGDILIFLHADTELPENALSLITRHLKPQKVWGHFDIMLIPQCRVRCAYHINDTVDSSTFWVPTTQLPVMFKIIAFMMNWRSRLTGIATGDQVIFVHKTAFDAVGGFPEISLMEDIALSRALKKISAPVCLKAKVKSSARRWQQVGIFKTILLMWSLRLRYWLGQDTQYLAELYRTGSLWKRKY